MPSQEAQKRSVFQQNLTIKEGHLKKKRGDKLSVVTPFTFKRRYFWLSYDNISFAKLPEDEVIQYTILVHYLKLSNQVTLTIEVATCWLYRKVYPIIKVKVKKVSWAWSFCVLRLMSALHV